MINPEVIASVAAILTMVSYIPQAIKTIKTRDTRGISFWMYVISILSVMLWLVYGFMISSGAIIFKNISVIILSSVILYIKVMNLFAGEEGVVRKRGFRKIKNKIASFFGL